MPTVWITFATEDNRQGDIDYLAQEISRCGWKTRMHPMFPGEDEKIDRLMPAFLGRAEQSDAWIVYGSERALEHGRAARIEAAVLRAVEARGWFPAIGLFPAMRPEPLGLTHTLGVSDVGWRERLGEALGCDLPGEAAEGLTSYVATVNPIESEEYRYCFDCRPKLGRWDSFLFAILPEEKARVAPFLPCEPVEEGFSDDAEWYFQISRRAATPMEGYQVLLRELPSQIAFGQEGTDEAVILHLRPKN